MADKPFKETTAFEKYAPIVGVSIVAIFFTIFGFFVKQDCDIDAIYLWCRLHPFSIADFIGCALFYGGCVLISGILPFRLYSPENSSKWNLILFAGMFLGLVLIWNL